jgi:hypothetical protein
MSGDVELTDDEWRIISEIERHEDGLRFEWPSTPEDADQASADAVGRHGRRPSSAPPFWSRDWWRTSV